PLVLQVLGPLAEDGAGENGVGTAHRQRAVEIGAGANDAIVADRDRAFNDRKSADFDVLAQRGFGGNGRRRVDSATRWDGHLRFPRSLGSVRTAHLPEPPCSGSRRMGFFWQALMYTKSRG